MTRVDHVQLQRLTRSAAVLVMLAVAVPELAAAQVDPIDVVELRSASRFVRFSPERAPTFFNFGHAFDAGLRVEAPSETLPRGAISEDIAPGSIVVRRHVGERWYFDLDTRWYVAESFTAPLVPLALPSRDTVRYAIDVDDERFLLFMRSGGLFLVDAAGASLIALPGRATAVSARPGHHHVELWVDPGILLDLDVDTRVTTILDAVHGVDLDALPAFRGLARAFTGDPPHRVVRGARGEGELGDRHPARIQGIEYAHTASTARIAFALGSALGYLPASYEAPADDEGSETTSRASHALLAMPYVRVFSDGMLAIAPRRVLRFGANGAFTDAWGERIDQLALSDRASNFAWVGESCDHHLYTNLCAVVGAELVPVEWGRNLITDGGVVLGMLGEVVVLWRGTERSPASTLTFVPVRGGAPTVVALEGITVLTPRVNRPGSAEAIGPYGQGPTPRPVAASLASGVVHDGVLTIAATVRGNAGVLRVGPGIAVETIVPNRPLAEFALAESGFGLGVDGRSRQLMTTRDGGRTFQALRPRRAAGDDPVVCGATRCAAGSLVVAPRSAMQAIARFRMVVVGR